MADNPLKRYLDAGIAFTALTQAKAEALVKDLVSAGEVQAEQAQSVAADLLDRSKQNTERLLATVRAEVENQVKALGLVGQAELSRLEKRIESLTGFDTATAVRKVAGRKASATRAETTATRKAAVTKAATTRKKAAAKKTAVAKTAAKKAPAKKAAAKKTTAKKSPAKKTTAKKNPAKKTTAKKSPAKKTAARKA